MLPKYAGRKVYCQYKYAGGKVYANLNMLGEYNMLLKYAGGIGYAAKLGW